MLYVGYALIVLAAVGTVYLLTKYEDDFIRAEVKIIGKICAVTRALRHKLGRWLLRDARRRPMSDATKRRIAFEYAAENGMILKKTAEIRAKKTSDEAFVELLNKIETK